jgi:hypothetical protein
MNIPALIMGMDAYKRLHELRRVSHQYAVYAVVAPLAHGLIAFGLGITQEIAASLFENYSGITYLGQVEVLHSAKF